MLAEIVVYGRVQGVGFRYTVMQKAIRAGVRGWVKNNDDGSVSIEAEGEEEVLKDFVGDLKKGLHPFVRITDMKVAFHPEEKGYEQFEVRYY